MLTHEEAKKQLEQKWLGIARISYESPSQEQIEDIEENDWFCQYPKRYLYAYQKASSETVQHHPAQELGKGSVKDKPSLVSLPEDTFLNILRHVPPSTACLLRYVHPLFFRSQLLRSHLDGKGALQRQAFEEAKRRRDEKGEHLEKAKHLKETGELEWKGPLDSSDPFTVKDNGIEPEEHSLWPADALNSVMPIWRPAVRVQLAQYLHLLEICGYVNKGQRTCFSCGRLHHESLFLEHVGETQQKDQGKTKAKAAGPPVCQSSLRNLKIRIHQTAYVKRGPTWLETAFMAAGASLHQGPMQGHVEVITGTSLADEKMLYPFQESIMVEAGRIVESENPGGKKLENWEIGYPSFPNAEDLNDYGVMYRYGLFHLTGHRDRSLFSPNNHGAHFLWRHPKRFGEGELVPFYSDEDKADSRSRAAFTQDKILAAANKNAEVNARRLAMLLSPPTDDEAGFNLTSEANINPDALALARSTINTPYPASRVGKYPPPSVPSDSHPMASAMAGFLKLPHPGGPFVPADQVEHDSDASPPSPSRPRHLLLRFYHSMPPEDWFVDRPGVDESGSEPADDAVFRLCPHQSRVWAAFKEEVEVYANLEDEWATEESGDEEEEAGENEDEDAEDEQAEPEPVSQNQAATVTDEEDEEDEAGDDDDDEEEEDDDEDSGSEESDDDDDPAMPSCALCGLRTRMTWSGERAGSGFPKLCVERDVQLGRFASAQEADWIAASEEPDERELRTGFTQRLHTRWSDMLARYQRAAAVRGVHIWS